MKRFAFELESVRSLREREEKEARAAYGMACRTRDNAQDASRNAELRLTTARLDWNERMTSGLEGSALRQWQVGWAVLQTQRDHLLHELRMAEGKVQSAQQKWQSTRQKLEGLEKLKEQKWTDYQAEANRLEVRQLDEIASARAANDARAFLYNL